MKVPLSLLYVVLFVSAIQIGYSVCVYVMYSIYMHLFIYVFYFISVRVCASQRCL